MKKRERRFGALVFLAVALTGCGEPWNCSSGTCRFEHAATGCTTRDAYEELKGEFDYINRTKDTSRIDRLYRGGLCRRFSRGTIVEVIESGSFTVKVRFVHSPNEPDRWMSAEMLRPRNASGSSSGRPRDEVQLGQWALWGSLVLAFALLLGGVAVMTVRGQTRQRPSDMPSVIRQTAPVDHEEERQEDEARRAKMLALKKDIIERSRD